MSMLLMSFSEIWNTLISVIVERFQLKTVIAGIIFAIIGLVLCVLARRIARAIRKSDTIDDHDTVYLVFKAIGLACLFVALLILIFKEF